MRLYALTVLASLTSFAFSHEASPAEASSDHVKRQSGVILTTGVTGGQPQVRQEIRDLQANHPKQYSMLMLAMEQWKLQPQDSDTSYYGISKIHGVPRRDWNNVSQCQSCQGPNVDGYCTHSQIVFPGWHRALMALFEQEFMGVVNQIANEWPENERAGYQQAASTMRFPYYDWAMNPGNGPAMPNSISASSITITAQNGSRTMPNPLYNFGFVDPSNMVYQYFTDWKFTLRYPKSDDPGTTSDDQGLINTFQQQQPTLRDQVYTLLTGCDNYEQFSTVGVTGSGACQNSLESIHDGVHNDAGGLGNDQVSGGHMTFLPEAAFDPIFWLHHGNVDRLFAFWTTLHTDYSAQQTTSAPTWAVAANTQLTMDSPLIPFRKDANNYWTCNGVKDWRTTFNYDYPEFAGTDRSAATIKAAVDKLYGPSASATAAQVKRDAEPQSKDLGDALGSLTNSIGEALLSPLQAKNGSSFAYFANIVTPRYLMNGSYSVLAFHGGPSNSNPGSWLSDKNLIGSMGVFAAPGRTSMTTMTRGQIPLATWLTQMQKQGDLKDLSEASVIPYLKKNLRMRIAGVGGRSLAPKDIKGFDAQVFSSTMAPLQDLLSSIPLVNAFSEFIHLTEVTQSLFEGL